MNFETSIVKSLNNWGAHHAGLVKFVANDFVYLAILLGVLTFLYIEYKVAVKPLFSPFNIRKLIADGALWLALPMVVAVVLSELLSKAFDRARPFVAHPNEIKALFPHSMDGGFPSHHMVFTVALAVCVIEVHDRIGWVVVAMAVLSGIARVMAGIHYPSDIIVGIIIGAVIPPITAKVLNRFRFKRL